MAKDFIVIEPDPVIRMDIEGLLIDTYPGCQVTAGSTLLDIGAAIYNCGPDSTLFVRGTMISESNGLGRVVQTAATRGCHVVIIGYAENLDYPVDIIELPFTSDMVIAAIVHESAEIQIKAIG